MSELGRLLAEARTAKELSLANVETVTRIRQKYLVALEAGEYASLPRGAIARGFLRTYARFLGLDVGEAIRRYAQESGDADEGVPIAEPGKPRLVDYRPLEVELLNAQPRANRWGWVVALLIIAALVASGWWYLNQYPGWIQSNLVPLLPRLAVATTTPVPPTATREVATITPPPAPTNSALVVPPTATSDLLPLPTPTVPPTITPTPRPTATPEVVTRIALTAKITLTSWVHVEVDGKVAEEDTLQPGQTRTWEADSSIVMRTGNGAGVTLSLNNQDLGVMGTINQVVERAWVVDRGAVTEKTPETVTRTPTATHTPAPTPSG